MPVQTVLNICNLRWKVTHPQARRISLITTHAMLSELQFMNIKNNGLLVVLLCSALLVACRGDNKKEGIVDTADTTLPDTAVPDTNSPPAENREVHFTFTSSITGISYPLHILLPKDYEESSRTYPVIYATDGQWIFRGFSNIIDAHNKNIILVAIEQGPNDRRAIDYRLPGAHTYFSFLTSELLPAIENDYRIDAENRTLVGTSYGGILSGLALLMDDVVNPAFKNYLSFDPSFYEHQSATLQVEQTRFNASNDLHATLVLTSATLRGNDIYVNWYKNLLEQREYSGLDIVRFSFAVDHNDVANPSFANALEVLFQD